MVWTFSYSLLPDFIEQLGGGDDEMEDLSGEESGQSGDAPKENLQRGQKIEVSWTF